jgi:hypothetical protein
MNTPTYDNADFFTALRTQIGANMFLELRPALKKARHRVLLSSRSGRDNIAPEGIVNENSALAH